MLATPRSAIRGIEINAIDGAVPSNDNRRLGPRNGVDSMRAYLKRLIHAHIFWTAYSAEDMCAYAVCPGLAARTTGSTGESVNDRTMLSTVAL